MRRGTINPMIGILGLQQRHCRVILTVLFLQNPQNSKSETSPAKAAKSNPEATSLNEENCVRLYCINFAIGKYLVFNLLSTKSLIKLLSNNPLQLQLHVKTQLSMPGRLHKEVSSWTQVWDLRV